MIRGPSRHRAISFAISSFNPADDFDVLRII